MSAQKLTFQDKTNVKPYVDRKRQSTAEDFNEIKTKFNDNADDVNTLYHNQGIAVPATDPSSAIGDANISYDVYEAGTYINFLDSGGNPIELEDGETANLRYNNNDAYWVKRALGQKDRVNYKFVPKGFDWTADLSAYANYILEIRFDHDVAGGDITLPDNVTLFFNGGSISNVNDFIGSNTKIKTDARQIFDSITAFSGTFNLKDGIYTQWFGALADGVDDYQSVVDSISFAKGINDKRIVFSGGEFSLNSNDLDLSNTGLDASDIKLVFKSGFISNYGTITVNRTSIESGLNKIFDTSGNFSGTLMNDFVFPEWFGAIGDFVTNDSSPINFCMSLWRNVKFTGNYLISEPIIINIGVSSGDYFESTNYGTLLEFDRAAIKASDSFVGNELILIDSPHCKIQGWGNFDANGKANYCIKIGDSTTASLASIERVRTYNYKIAGIFGQVGFGNNIDSVYGASSEETAEALIYFINQTAIKVNNCHNFRQSHYLVKFNDVQGGSIVNCAADKSDFGLSFELSSSHVHGMNFEGVKYPLLVNRSFVTLNCRIVATGGLALSPENSTDGINLNIGDAATRKAGTYIIKSQSGRLVIDALKWQSGDSEYGLITEDFSSSNSNDITFHSGYSFENFTNSITTTTKLYFGEDSLINLTNSIDLVRQGPGSGLNRIEPDTINVQNGITIALDSIWYSVKEPGVYQIDFHCTFDGLDDGLGEYFDLSILDKNTNTIRYTSRHRQLTTPQTCTARYTRILGGNNGFRIQATTNLINVQVTLKNIELTIKRIGNVT